MVSKCAIDTVHCNNTLLMVVLNIVSSSERVSRCSVCAMGKTLSLNYVTFDTKTSATRKQQISQPRRFEILTQKGPWNCWTHIVGLWDCSRDSLGLEVLFGEVKLRFVEVADV